VILTRIAIMPQPLPWWWRMGMARAPTEQKTADEIISQLDGLDASNLGRIIEAASGLRATKQAAEREAFIAKVREEASALGLDPADLFARPAPAPSPTRKAAAGGTPKTPSGSVPAKYRGPDSQVWSGRGKAPSWLAELEKQGRSRDEFLIKDGQPDLIETARREHAAE
jgi:DNA-binding protein H-NS